MTSPDHRPKLKLIEGGRSMPVSKMHRILMEAYVSNTRLMGVLAVAAHWSIVPPDADRNDPANWEDLHQFFYIDCEEAGLETYQQVRDDNGENEAEAERIENALFAGLGGDEMLLEERQLRLLLQKWAQFNAEHDLPLPAGRENYDF
ncbi:MAG: hypothetical protein Q4D59_09555, partial [Erysipelotrichaceae bacterium]|nr:hypothetical protein [Erysipelotrichaceae bacterium]